MEEEPLTEPKQENQESETPTKINRKAPRKLHEFEDQSSAKASSKARKIKGALLAVNKPSYCLKKGVGSLQCGGESLRSQHRKRLWRLLKKLIRRHNWADASGVLSVLLQGTVRDQSLSRNRAKYSAALELLNHIKGQTISSRKIQSVYELWMKKVGPLKNWSTKMLLLGDQVHEALNELETLFHSSETVLQLRLKASLLEHFDSGNYVKLSTCFEDILKKDPTCNDSLARLVLMHRRGDYETENLVEMLALHLDSSYGMCETWQELASCFLKLSQCEGDRVSTCFGGSDRYNEGYLDHSNKIPELFTNGESGKTWRLRSRWWLNRHFHDRILISDNESGDLTLLTYKAAAASHIYGRHFEYVVKTTEIIEKENDMELYSFLQTHILNSVGFYSLKRNT
ncbi:hypothetical protein Sango_2581600 [Sesamum angolense]|uniref:Uncharacterized protein n=1 Tax=Sesamum angolense TaxID=2727404 RepID=A0AAE2BIX9_9LAMI|nr:hypothetical protein Sango_2581600 [Sesamum angolense]